MPQFIYSRTYLVISMVWVFLVLYFTSPLPYVLRDPLITYYRETITIWTLCASFFLVWSCMKFRGKISENLWARYLFSIILVGVSTLPWTLGNAESVYPEPAGSATSYFAGITLAILLITVWRILGIWVALITTFFLTIHIWGHHLSGVWSHRELNLSDFIQGWSAQSITLNSTTDLVLPLILLGSILDTLVARHQPMKKSFVGKAFDNLYPGSLPKIFIRHFWVWTLFIFYFPKEIWSQFKTVSDITLRIVEHLFLLLPAIILVLVLLLVLKFLNRDRKQNSSRAEKITGSLGYLGFLTIGLSTLLPSGATYAVWAWRDRKHQNLSDQSKLLLPLDYLMTIFIIVATAVLLLVIEMILWQGFEWIGLKEILGMRGNYGDGVTTFMIFFTALVTIGACALKKYGFQKYIGTFSILTTIIGLIFLTTQIMISSSLSIFYMTIPALFILMGSPLVYSSGSNWGSVWNSLSRTVKPLLMRFPVMAIIVTLSALSGDVIVTVVDQTGIGEPLLKMLGQL